MFKKIRLSQNLSHSVGRSYQVNITFEILRKSISFLLGIKSPYRTTRRYVDQANCDIYKRLHSTLATCRIIQNTTPIAQQFLSMYLLDSHAIKLPISSTVRIILRKSIENFLFSLNRKIMNHFYQLQILFVHFLIMITNNDQIQLLNVGL